jgi:hypothetical protein
MIGEMLRPFRLDQVRTTLRALIDRFHRTPSFNAYLPSRGKLRPGWAGIRPIFEEVPDDGDQRGAPLEATAMGRKLLERIAPAWRRAQAPRQENAGERQGQSDLLRVQRSLSLLSAITMSALCQKQTFRPLLDIIVGGQACSSSWSITRETSPPTFPASGSGRYAAPDRLAHCNGANLSVAAGAVDRWIRARRRI